jgi:hypothetical protein
MSSIYEAVAAANNITVKKVKDILNADKKSQGKIPTLEAEVAALKQKLEKYENFVKAAEDAGIFVTALD